MSKVLFVPFSVAGGLLAGFVSRKLFRGMWRLVDDRQAPDPKHREIDIRLLVPALLLEGAIFRAVRGLFDHVARRTFNAFTGVWPGDRRPEAG